MRDWFFEYCSPCGYPPTPQSSVDVAASTWFGTGLCFEVRLRRLVSSAEATTMASSGVVQWLACWAHNPTVPGLKPCSGMLSLYCKYVVAFALRVLVGELGDPPPVLAAAGGRPRACLQRAQQHFRRLSTSIFPFISLSVRQAWHHMER